MTTPRPNPTGWNVWADMSADRAVIAAGGSVHFPIWQQTQPRWFPMEFGWVVGCSYTGMPQQAVAVRNVWACLCARRDYLVAAGGFRDDLARVGTLPTGGDETELCLRLAAGCRRAISCTSRAQVSITLSAEPLALELFLEAVLPGRECEIADGALCRYAHRPATETKLHIRVLPRGVMKGLGDTFFHGDISGLARAGAIIAGLVTTAAGYLPPKPRLARGSPWQTTAMLKEHDGPNVCHATALSP